MNSSKPGDTILINRSYAGDETIFVELENLIVNAPANVSGIVLYLRDYQSKVTLAGGAPIEIVGSGGGDTIIGNAGANVISDQGGAREYDDDTIDGGGARTS